MSAAAEPRTRTKRWYIVHAFSNFEKKVADDIKNGAERLGLEGLFEEIVGALPDRGHCGLDGAVPADDYDRHVGVGLAQHREEIETIDLASLQPDVEDRERGTPPPYGVNGLIAVTRRAHLVAGIFKDA